MPIACTLVKTDKGNPNKSWNNGAQQYKPTKDIFGFFFKCKEKSFDG